MKKYSRICITDTAYTLFFYCLNYSVEEIKNTFFFVSDGLPKSTRDKLSYYHYFKKRKKTLHRLLFRLRLRFFFHFRWHFFKNTSICGLDHLTYSSGIIGNKYYTLLEDAPFIASRYFDSVIRKENISQRKNKLKSFFMDFLFGPIFLRPFGENDQCKEFVFSQKDYSPILEGKKIVVHSLYDLWTNSPEEKKEYILHLFDINENDLERLASKSIILFTQPFVTDGVLSEEEQIEVLDAIIKQNPKQEILIKPHPRDRIDYSQYFSEIEVFNKPVPIQLLDLLNIRFKKAITITSSSVLSFSYDVEIDWIGTKIHPKLEACYGELKMPNKI
jgi:hypothetical protein